MDLSASCKEIFVDFGSPIFNFLHKDRGVIVILAPKSQRALLISSLPTTQGIVILPRSFSLGGSLFLMTALHSSFRGIVSCASYFLLFDSFKNLAYLGIWMTASKKGIVMSSCLNTFRAFWNCLSRAKLCNLWGNGKHWVFTSFGSCTSVCVFWVISGSASYSLFLSSTSGRFLPLLKVTACACSLGF